MERFESYARFTGDDQFKEIAELNLARFNELNPKVTELEEVLSKIVVDEESMEGMDEWHFYYEKLDPIEDERNRNCVIAIVFAAMYFEAFMYDYAASCLGDSYAKNHLDKLDFLSKWVVIPKLVTGQSLDKGDKAYQALKRLHKDRNRLVHLKSENVFNKPERRAMFRKERERDIQESCKNCRMALDTVIDELFLLDPTHPKLILAHKARNKTRNEMDGSVEPPIR